MIEEEISEEIKELAEQAELNIIPAKSKEAYYKEYSRFSNWMKQKAVTTVTESLMLAYMLEMSKLYKSSTAWCIHSKLQTMLRIKKGIDLAGYHKLHAFMKSLNKGYEAKKSLVFTEEELRKFFIEAPDHSFLFLKVVAICGIFGSCRRYELCNLRMSDIREEGSSLFVTIRPSKTDKGRKFVVIDDGGIQYLQLFKKYLSLRPKNINSDRVFLKYKDGICVRQVVGINTFGKCPSLVARFLNISDAKKYTGHAFRRTSATIMANAGMNIDELKRQVGWKSSAVATGYIEESASNRMKVSKVIAKVVDGVSVTTTRETNNVTNVGVRGNREIGLTDGIQISNNENCTFNIYLK